LKGKYDLEDLGIYGRTGLKLFKETGFKDV
jgi:hypothetical protein